MWVFFFLIVLVGFVAKKKNCNLFLDCVLSSFLVSIGVNCTTVSLSVYVYQP